MIRDEGPFACALGALRRGDFASAEAEFTSLLAEQHLARNDRLFLLNKRGVARIGLKRPEQARADFEAALELEPSFAPAIANLGNLLLEEGDLDGAIAAYERAIACDGDYAVAYLNLGVAYKRRGRVADGVRALRHAQRLEGRAIAAASWKRVRRR
ncbi:MAG: tetratricopeptide repeat protein [Candidatus Eremiobacteraeota bacterium]|nr:tetratricopeptide repeat protein [Candidatus Eremiobacteraeota bacterium]